MKALSATLRDDGALLARIGKEIEDSQVEDGDPPYEITESQDDALLRIAVDIASSLRKLKPKERKL